MVLNPKSYGLSAAERKKSGVFVNGDETHNLEFFFAVGGSDLDFIAYPAIE